MKRFLIVLIILVFSYSANVFADDADTAKEGIINKFTSSISSALETMIGGDGDTEVMIKGAQDYHPEFSIMTVRPISLHPEVDAWFVQLQLNEVKIRNSGRYSINAGVGYRNLSEEKTSFTGGNVFIDWDEKGNARASIGLELRASAFEAFTNYYHAISGGKTVGSFT